MTTKRIHPLFFFTLTTTIFLIIIQSCCTTSKIDETSTKETLIIQLYESLFSLLSYFDRTKEQMIIDSAMGVRMFIDQSNFLMPRTKGIYRRMLHQLQVQASKLLDESLPYVIQSDFKTFQSKFQLL